MKAGVYYPDLGSGQTDNDRNATFHLKPGIRIYGGFAGWENDLGQRAWQANATVLSGDIDQNDKVDARGVVTDSANIVGANSFHVVSAATDATALLDGFYITGGDTATNSSGGGMIIPDGSPQLAQLYFVGNRASFGGGLWRDGSGVLALTDVTFERNQALQNGAGAWIKGPSSITRASFQYNMGYRYGGGLYIREGFAGSAANPAATTSIQDTQFVGNAAMDGGGLYLRGDSPVMTSTVPIAQLAGVNFNANVAAHDGGGLFITGASGQRSQRKPCRCTLHQLLSPRMRRTRWAAASRSPRRA